MLIRSRQPLSTNLRLEQSLDDRKSKAMRSGRIARVNLIYVLCPHNPFMPATSDSILIQLNAPARVGS